jgi:condensin complex subunit 2
MRGKRARINENGDGEVDADFWAQAAAEQAGNRDQDADDSENHCYSMIGKIH